MRGRALARIFYLEGGAQPGALAAIDSPVNRTRSGFTCESLKTETENR